MHRDQLILMGMFVVAIVSTILFILLDAPNGTAAPITRIEPTTIVVIDEEVVELEPVKIELDGK